MVLGFLPKAHMDRMNMPAEIFTPREPDEVIAPCKMPGSATPRCGDRAQKPHGSLRRPYVDDLICCILIDPFL